MTMLFDHLRGIIPPIYRENKSAKVKSGEVIRKAFKQFKVDGRFTRWLPYYFFKRYKQKGWRHYFLKKEK